MEGSSRFPGAGSQEPQPSSRENMELALPLQATTNPDQDPRFHFRLGIPSPVRYYDNYHHPLFPRVMPWINCWADPARRLLQFPAPLGPILPHHYNLLGAQLHDFGYVNSHPEKLFVKIMLWYVEVDDYLFRLICPSDLNNMPCEWDELQGGCPMLRLCEMRRKYPHPHLGQIPSCNPRDYRSHCRHVHDISPSCRSIAKQLLLPEEERFVGWQLCSAVAEGGICGAGHDFESARAEAVYRYWAHRAEARARGSIGHVKRDIARNRWIRPIKPVDVEDDS